MVNPLRKVMNEMSFEQCVLLLLMIFYENPRMIMEEIIASVY